MNRTEFQTLSRERLREARVLLRAMHYGGAYYLAGYAAECALKACIAKQTRRFDFPDKKTVDSSYTHHLQDLVRVAGLQANLDSNALADRAFRLNWNVVKDWRESSRYDVVDAQRARDIVAALSGQHGVLQWLKQHW